MLRDFDESLFMTTPSVVLEEEDKRLVRLDKKTQVEQALDQRWVLLWELTIKAYTLSRLPFCNKE